MFMQVSIIIEIVYGTNKVYRDRFGELSRLWQTFCNAIGYGASFCISIIIQVKFGVNGFEVRYCIGAQCTIPFFQYTIAALEVTDWI